MLVPVSLPLFAYGTLLHPEFVANLLERPFIPESAELFDFALVHLHGLPYPVVEAVPGSKVQGRLYRHLTDEDFARLDAYEGVAEGLYQRATAEIATTASGAATERAYVYVPTFQTLSRYG